MAEKLDYAHLGFAYHVPEKRYVSNYRNGAWDKGCLSEDSNVVLNESAGILQYCQQVFEGVPLERRLDCLLSSGLECREDVSVCGIPRDAKFSCRSVSFRVGRGG